MSKIDIIATGILKEDLRTNTKGMALYAKKGEVIECTKLLGKSHNNKDLIYSARRKGFTNLFPINSSKLNFDY